MDIAFKEFATARSVDKVINEWIAKEQPERILNYEYVIKESHGPVSNATYSHVLVMYVPKGGNSHETTNNF